MWIAVVYGTGTERDAMLWFGEGAIALSAYLTIGTALKAAFGWNLYFYYEERFGDSRRLLSKHGLQLIILD